MTMPKETGLSIYRKMLTIRRFEEQIAEGCKEKKVICPAHLYIGQEAVASAVCEQLNKEDYVFGTHRAHGCYLAKGGDLNKIAAELYGKVTGCSRGRGGSMHVVAPEIGVLGTSAIVAGTIPLGVGAALAAQIRKDGRISAIFFGDGATDEGTFHESLNFAALRKLPVLFVCENNSYSTHLHISLRQPRHDISRFAEAQAVTWLQGDGNNAADVYEKTKKAVEMVRAGNGPVFLEFFVNRWRGHVGPNWDYDIGLRSKEQIEQWVRDCPIELFASYLKNKGLATEDELKKIGGEVEDSIKEAIKFAEDSPYPDASTMADYVFKGGSE
ncbi:thiamine pyrophosphate-dependent dehydrogenase E1 component subunit alpha [archaeon]